MRVLVTPHHFEIGGSQINALELAETINAMPGFEVVLYAPDGVLVDDAHARGLELHLTELNLHAPSPRRIAEMVRLVRQRKIDLIHTYEWPTTIDGLLGPNFLLGTPMVASIMSVDIPESIPRTLPMVVCMPHQFKAERERNPDVHLIEVPVDTDDFRPGRVSPEAVASVRRECGAEDGETLVVAVSRLSYDLKLEGLLTLAAAAGRLADAHKFRVAIVGDGPGRQDLEAVAAESNAAAGRDVVVLLGERSDPRPYYQAADVSVGMGGSALRALAFGKPLLVQGESAFWLALDEDTSAVFAQQGWHGLADGTGAVERCCAELTKLLVASAAERERLGALGLRIVTEKHSLRAAGQTLAAIYEDVADRKVDRLAQVRRALHVGGPMLSERVVRHTGYLKRRMVRRFTR